MSTLSDEYIKNFSKERKAVFNKRFRDDYDPNMSERSNIIRILGDMRELGLADGGRIALKEGLGSFETNDPKEAMKEIINRVINKNVKGTTLPITENIFLNLGPNVSDVELGGIMELFGGELSLGGGLKQDDKGIGFSFKKEFNKGGRVAYQDGTEYNEDSKEKLQDIFTTGMEKINRATGIDQITSANFPGSFSDATGSSSDFRHQASADLLAEALGKGKFGTVGYLSGAIGSSGLGAIKEIGDLAQNLYQGDMSAKDAFSQFLEDNVSNIKGAFTPPNTTTEELYEKIMGDYQIENPFGILRADRAMMIQAAQQRAIDAMRKNRRDKDKKIKTTKPGTSGGFKKTKKITTTTGTTKPGTGGGGGGFDTSAADKAGTSLGSGQFSPKTSKGRSGYTSGGIARMLGE
jgi:hypothetical protein